MTAGLGLVTNALTKILGAQVLRDMQTFVAAFDTLFGGFRAAGAATFALLQADGTSFLVIAAPEPDALREAAYFVERLTEDEMPLAGLVVNRASPRRARRPHRRRGDGRGGPAARASPDSTTAGLLRLHADRVRMVDARGPLRERLAPPTRRCRPRWCRRWRPTSTTSTGCAASARCWPGERRRPGRLRATARRSDGGGDLDVLDARGLEHGAPRRGGRRRSRARRSRSVMPPQTPHSIWLSRASARHSVRTGHPAHTCLALFCSAPRTNSASGVSCLQAARGAQSSTHMSDPHISRASDGHPHSDHSRPEVKGMVPVSS